MNPLPPPVPVAAILAGEIMVKILSGQLLAADQILAGLAEHHRMKIHEAATTLMLLTQVKK